MAKRRSARAGLSRPLPEVFKAFKARERWAAMELAAVTLGYLRKFRAYRFESDWPDIVNQVLRKLWEARDRIRNPSCLMGWIRTTVKHELSDLDKDARRMQFLADPSPEADDGLDLDLPDLYREIQMLPERLQEVIREVYFPVEGTTTREGAAARLRLNMNTLNERVTEALRTLQAHFLPPAAQQTPLDDETRPPSTGLRSKKRTVECETGPAVGFQPPKHEK